MAEQSNTTEFVRLFGEHEVDYVASILHAELSKFRGVGGQAEFGPAPSTVRLAGRIVADLDVIRHKALAALVDQARDEAWDEMYQAFAEWADNGKGLSWLPEKPKDRRLRDDQTNGDNDA